MWHPLNHYTILTTIPWLRDGKKKSNGVVMRPCGKDEGVGKGW